MRETPASTGSEVCTAKLAEAQPAISPRRTLRSASAIVIVSGEWLALGAGAVLIALVVARSWLCDDAYITLRTLDNWVHGFGLRWNVDERVQTYTHPLWLLLLAPLYAATRDPYFSPLVMGWLCTLLAAAVLALRLARSPAAGAWALAALALSSAFTDYSSAGLENPLSHALLALYWLCVLEQRGLRAALLCASGLALARPDAPLLVLPSLLVQLWAARRALPWRQLLIGCSPWLLWTAFALTYYGFAWPNTAFAKLGSGVPAYELALQGLHYLAESLQHDPVTLSVCALAAWLALRSAPQLQAAMLGVGLYLLWIIKLGGDFMSGRFLTLPLFVSAIVSARRGFDSPRLARALLALLAVLGVLSPRPSWRIGAASGAATDAAGVADERSFYLADTGLWARLRTGPELQHRARQQALELRGQGPKLVRLTTLGCGIFGYYAGPDVHIVDEWALTDPLLARLPALRQLHFRIGHFARAIPRGYMKTLASGRNQLRDQDLARYWDQLALVVRAPLFSPGRWRAIASFALGTTDRALARERFRFADMVHTRAQSIAAAQGGVRFGDGGLWLSFEAPISAPHLALTLQGGSRFALTWYHGTKNVGGSDIELAGAGDAEITAVVMPAPGSDHLRILPLRGASAYRITQCVPSSGS